MIQITGFDDDAWQPLGPPRCDMQVLSDSSVSTVLGFRIGAGGCGPSLHYHPVDQLIVATDHDIHLTLGAESMDLHPGEAALVPAGLAHACANTGGATEHHVEAFIPPLPRNEPPFATVGDHRDAPGSDRRAAVLSRSTRGAETDTHHVDLPATASSEVEIHIGEANLGLRRREPSTTE